MKRSVLFLIESLSGGGAEKVLSTLLQHLDYSKFDVTLCSVVDKGKYIDEVRPYVRYTYILPDADKLSGWRLLFYKIKYHLIYNMLPFSLVYSRFVPHYSDVEIAFVEGFVTKLLSHSTNHNAHKIAWVHIDLNTFHWTKSLYDNVKQEENVYNRYNQIVTVSNTAKLAFHKAFHNVNAPVDTLYNPIDDNEIKYKASQTIVLSQKQKDIIRMVSLGRLCEQKAYDRLLRVVNKLKINNYNVELWLLGDGPERQMLENYINNNGLEDIVTLWGFQSNPYPYLANCDLFVCSSVSEGYSTAVTEALILGLPVVTTDCSGMTELLKGGECGVITENSEDALFDGIKKVLESPYLLERYRQKAIARGRKFSIESLMMPIEKLLLK